MSSSKGETIEVLYLKKLVEISASLEVFSQEALEDLLETLKYAGFNPAEFLKLLLKHAEDAKVSKENFIVDMMTLVTLYVARGNYKLENKGTKISAKGLEIVKKLFVTYKITSKVATPGTTLAVDDVTLSRIAATFPNLVALVIAKTPNARVLGDTDWELLPIFLCFPAGSALLPMGASRSDHAAHEMWQEFEEWQASFQAIIRPRNPSASSSKGVQANYAEIANNNTLMSDAVRLAAIEKCYKAADLEIPAAIKSLYNVKEEKKKSKA